MVVSRLLHSNTTEPKEDQKIICNSIQYIWERHPHRYINTHTVSMSTCIDVITSPHDESQIGSQYSWERHTCIHTPTVLMSTHIDVITSPHDESQNSKTITTGKRIERNRDGRKFL